MRIALFTESLPPQTDGVSHTMSRLAETLENLEIDYQFFSPFKPDASINWHNRVREVISVPFPLYTDYRIGLPMFEKLYDALNNFSPDIIHVASPTPLGIAGLDYADKFNLPAVSSYHTHFVSYFKYYGFRMAEKLGWSYLRWFHNRSHTTFAPSTNVIEELEQQGFREVRLWPRGVNLNKFSPSFRDLRLRESIGAKDIPILLFVGRLVKEKDLDNLVEADKFLKNRGHMFKLIIVGDGPMREELMKTLPNAHFPGYQFSNDLSRWYASSDIFVFPSTTETFGNVIMEAFASGIPAIGVKKGGVADLITNGQNGFLTLPNEPKAFADKISVLLENETYRKKLGANARITASRKSWEAVNTKLIENYHNILLRYYSNN